MSSKGKTKESRAMEHMKNHNTCPPGPSDSFSSRGGKNSSYFRPSHNKHSRTTSSSRKQVADNSSPEGRPSRTRSLDDYYSCHYRRRNFSPVHHPSAIWQQDRSRPWPMML